jgi:hypothetical protein
MQFHRIVNLILATAFLGAIGYLDQIQVRDGHYFSAVLLTVFLGSIAAGLVLRRRWAAQATTFLLVGTNLLAIFFYFPPFGDEANTSSLSTRLLQFVAITIGCLGISFILYLQQRKQHPD